MADTPPFGPAHGFGLYIHWPYCTRICPYCDFNVYAAKDRDNAPLNAALLSDLGRHADLLAGHPDLGSVYLGGGTPSLMAPADITALIDLAEQRFGLAPEAEITLEANPVDISRASLDSWKTAGVTRLSLGIQSLEDEALTFLGRDHDAAMAKRSVAEALSVFDNVSIDLIYARPGQPEDRWKSELTEALSLGAPHLSLYELTIEERTAFGQRARRGDLVPMGDDDQADLYELTQEICEAHGLPAYEVSNHAASKPYQSRHNLTYWRGGDWIGIGPGAHGRLTVDGQRIATHAAARPADYQLAAQNSLDAKSLTTLSTLDNTRELLALGLRSDEGFDLERVARIIGRHVDTSALKTFSENGLVRQNGQTISLTQDGRLLADRITAELSP
ncbi:radical SAM family heme chaperone HemW [Henriciella barbarensis]|uniref:Heme chaperone HemW n=1 Tax=Henriciella barbarensis TaxID=86342 RepID=A0A399QYT8_9PROT|nr:radical SAM family heme chaperone HemW [Henriciella barbarensis]RIJ23394.1 radical SAM family heme chaperone HemW [Henriciella barbarensis]